MTPERWSTYKPCQQCEAPKGQPCRDQRWPTKHYRKPDRYYRVTGRPHAGRQRWTRVIPGVNRCQATSLA